MRASHPIPAATRPRPRTTLTGAVALVALAAAPAAAQRNELAVEVGASHFLQPSGLSGSAARFVLSGLRGSWTTPTGSGIQASLLGGWSADEATGGDFLSLEAVTTAWVRVGSQWALGLQGRGVGFLVASPFTYGAGAAELGPSLAWFRRDLSLTVDGIAGFGGSRLEVETLIQDDGQEGGQGHGPHGGQGVGASGDSTVLSVIREDLWRYGGKVQAFARLGPLKVGVGGGIHETSGGLFRSIRLATLGGGRGVLVGARVDVWWTPEGRETAAAVSVSVPLGSGWNVRAFVGKTEPDPLTLATSSGRGAGVLVGRRLAGPSPPPAEARPVHRVVDRSSSESVVRFTVHVPGGAGSVALLGDFTLWELREMEREDGYWTLEMQVRHGLYHYGFMVDGEWFVPEEAEDVVPDEWGRMSVTLLVGGEGG